MKPGRELDALIAEKVMGLTAPDKLGPLPDKAVPGNLFELVPHYSTDISAAWAVVEKLLSTGIDFCLEGGPNKTTGERYFGVGINDVDFQYAETAPHAICLAAIKAVGVEI